MLGLVSGRLTTGGLAVALVLVVGGVGACGDDGDGAEDLTEAQLAEILRDEYEVPAEQADCVAGQAFARLTSDELALLQERDDEDEVPVELQRKLRAAVTPCAGAG